MIDEQPWEAGPGEQAQIATWEAFFNEPSRQAPTGGALPLRTPVPGAPLLQRTGYRHLLRAGALLHTPRAACRYHRHPAPQRRPGRGLFTTACARLSPPWCTRPTCPTRWTRTAWTASRTLFLAGDWEVSELPDYSRDNAVNPVATFNDIPAGARYRFMLDNAEYFVTTFIRGPVCAGQIATNVIEDQFWVMFQDPQSDLSVTDPDYLASILPAPGAGAPEGGPGHHVCGLEGPRVTK